MPEKILVVDDDVDSLKLIGLMLQRHGYEVVQANTGSQALSKANAERPNLIILDVMMPDMNGYEVCKRLRGNPNTQPIPIIMFTAKTLIDDKVAGFEAGADDYLTKPTHPAELASRVKAVLARTAARQEQAPQERGRTIGVLGVKGGVGTTTIAYNLAAAMLQANENPIVTDFRLGEGSLGLFMGFPRSQGLARVLSKSPAEINVKLVENELVSHQSGLRGLLSSARPKETQINYQYESATAVVKALRVLGRPAVFDLGSGYTAMIHRLQSEMDRLILIVEPNSAALTMGREILQEMGTSGRVMVIVVNRAQSSLQTSWNDIEQLLGQELKAIISAAPELAFQSIEASTPMVLLQPNAMVSSQIVKLAEDVKVGIRSLA